MARYTTNLKKKKNLSPRSLHASREQERYDKNMRSAALFPLPTELIGPERVKEALKIPGLHHLGRGNRGVVYHVKTTTWDQLFAIEALRKRLDSSFRGVDKVVMGDDVVIKVAFMSPSKKELYATEDVQRRRRLWKNFLVEQASEASMHDEIRRSRPFFVGTGSERRQLVPKDLVPAFYFSGIDLDHGIYVTAMKRVEGRTFPFDPAAPPSALVAARLEKALLTLHCLGIVHGDLHENNVMIREPGQGIAFIDFGFSLHMPRSTKDKVCRVVSDAYDQLRRTGTWPGDKIKALWYRDGIGKHVDQVMKNRMLSFYNPNGKFLAHKLESAAGDLDAARLKAWNLDKSSLALYRERR